MAYNLKQRIKSLNFLLTNVKALQVFHLLRQGAVILIAIVFANSSLPVQVIGNYEQLLYIGYTLSFFWVAGLIQGFLSSFHEKSTADQKVFLFNAYLLFLAISLFLFFLMLSIPQVVFGLFTDGKVLVYYQLYLVYLLLNMPTYLVENIYILKEKAGKIYLFGIYSFAGHFLVLALPTVLGFDFYYAMLGLVLLALSKHLWLIRMIVKMGTPRIDIRSIRPWFFLSFPLILYALLGGLMQTFDNWLINYWYNGDQTIFAIFRYGARELPLALALAAAFSSAMLPEVNKALNPALKAIKSKSLQLFHLLFPITILLLLTSRYWFTWVFSEAFEESIIVFDTYLLIISSRLLFSRTILMGLKDNQVVLYISILEFLINIGLSFLFIAWWGLPGVAMATVIAYLVEKFLICYYLYWKYQIPLSNYAAMRWWNGYTLALFFIYFYINTAYFSF